MQTLGHSDRVLEYRPASKCAPEGKEQADLLRRLEVFGRKQSLLLSGIPVRAAGTKSRYKVGIYSDRSLVEALSLVGLKRVG